MKPLLSGILLVALAGCTHVRVSRDGLRIPDGIGKTLPIQQENLRDCGIQFDALYVHKAAWPGWAPPYSWYRFWPNGRVLGTGWSPTEPTALQGDAFSGDYAYVGRYCVVGRDVTIEMYERPGDEWLFRTYSGTLKANGDLVIGLVRWKIWPLGLEKSIDMAAVYQRRVVGEMHREPEW